MKVSIVIPCYNKYHLLHQVLWDLYQHCKSDIDEIVVVDDASTDEGFQDGLKDFWFKQQLLPIKVLTLKQNVGFLKASNAGMKFSTGDIIILLSNDVRVQDNFIKAVKNLVQSESMVLIGNRLIAFDTGWNVFNGKTYQYLEGWLLACTMVAWKDLGGFDEKFAPNDYEDIDLSTKAVKKGYLLLSMDNLKVAHIGAQSYGYNPEREAITKINKEKFGKKWAK